MPEGIIWVVEMVEVEVETIPEGIILVVEMVEVEVEAISPLRWQRLRETQ